MTKDRQLMFVTDLSFGQPSGKLEHLSCFLPGLLALGAHRLPSLSAEERQLHLWAAEGLAHTCWLTYADSPTGLGPDEAVFPTWTSERWVDVLDQWKGNGSHGRPPATGQAEPEHDQSKQNYNVLHDGYLLRPEV
jgi:mannosyl-oligosaccharide alpha-1,2-mannosidase